MCALTHLNIYAKAANSAETGRLLLVDKRVDFIENKLSLTDQATALQTHEQNLTRLHGEGKPTAEGRDGNLKQEKEN